MSGDVSDSVLRAQRNLSFALEQEAVILRKRVTHLEKENARLVAAPPPVDTDTELAAAKERATRAEYDRKRTQEDLDTERAVKANLTKSLAVAIEEKARLASKLAEASKSEFDCGELVDALWKIVGHGHSYQKIDSRVREVVTERNDAQAHLGKLSAENSTLRVANEALNDDNGDARDALATSLATADARYARIEELEKRLKPDIAANTLSALEAARALNDSWEAGDTEGFSLSMLALSKALSSLDG